MKSTASVHLYQGMKKNSPVTKNMNDKVFSSLILQISQLETLSDTAHIKKVDILSFITTPLRHLTDSQVAIIVDLVTYLQWDITNTPWVQNITRLQGFDT